MRNPTGAHPLETKDVADKALEQYSMPGKRAPALQPGQVLRERYQILSILGTGGMSAVYEARDLAFPNVVRKCAIKEIQVTTTNAAVERQQRSSFEREVDILAGLSHPAIPKIYEYLNEGPYCYLVIELIRGQNLETFLRQSAEMLPERTVVRWAIEICDVLNYLHTCQPEPIVFRDMKPSNIMLNEHGHVVLIDFGIAKVFRGEQRGTMIGTEGYSPPEQYRGEATPQGDIYALGATMHHLLSGCDPTKEPPFSFHERPLQQHNATVSHDVEAVVARALSYKPEERFASIAELKAALEGCGTRTAPPAAATVQIGTRRAGPEEIEPAWVFQCEDEIRSSPRIGNGSVFIGCYDSNLYAIDVKDGHFVWKYPTEGGIASTPAVWEDLVLIGSEDFCMHAVAARSGRQSWVCPTKGRVRSSVRLAYEHAFFGSDDQNIYAVHARTGRLVWKSPAEGPVRSTPAVGGESLYVGCEDGHVYALHLQRGAMQWRYHCGGGVTSSPALWEGLVIVGSTDRNVYALDVVSGMPVWRFRTAQAIISSPAVQGEVAYIGSADGVVYALEAGTGRLRWKFETGGQVNSSPALAPGFLYVGSGDGHLYCIETRTGKPHWQFKSQGPIVSSPVVGDHAVYVGSLDGRLYALPA